MSETRVYTQLVHCGPSTLKCIDWCEASAKGSDGTVYYARLQCAFPENPVAVELLNRLARQRAEDLARNGRS